MHVLKIFYFLNDVEHLGPGLYGISLEYVESMYLPCFLVHVIEIFWRMDHGLYKDIEEHDFFSVSMNGRRVFEWQHEFVIYNLMKNNLKRSSLKYVSLYGSDMLSIEEVKKKISIYVTNSRVCEGYTIMKDFKDTQHYPDLFEEFVRLCDEAGKFDLVLKVEFDAVEEAMITQYIVRSKPCGVFLYLLMNNRISDALKMCTDLSELFDSSSLRELIDIYIQNFCDSNLEEDDSTLVYKGSFEVNQSFSVAVGKTMSSHEVISRMRRIYNDLNTRFTSNYQPITESNMYASFEAYQLSSSFQGIQTPQRRTTSTHAETEAQMETHSPFALFLTDFHGFKNRMTSGGDAVTHGDSSFSGVNTPVFDEVDRQLESVFTLSTPTSILKRPSGPRQPQSKSIRFVESPGEVSSYVSRLVT